MLSKEEVQRLSGELKIDKERIAREFYEILILNEIARLKWSRQLIFKGGTALRLAYKSPRFSDDLDFSMTKKFDPNNVFKFAETISRKYGILIRDQWDKRETTLVEFAIEEDILPQRFGLKIEISKRPSINIDYELKLLHTPVSPLEVLFNVQTLESVMLDKLSALKERDEPRDLFDMWFICQKLEKPFSVKSRLDNSTVKKILHKYLPINWYRVIDEIYQKT